MSEATPIWIDTDIALGSDRGDVDDGFAVAAVLAVHGRRNRQSTTTSGFQLTGISAVAGNTDASTALECARRLVDAADVAQAEIPVVPANQAAESIAALPDGASIVAIGPLTNVAAALEIDSNLLQRTTVRIVATVRDHRRHPILPRFCLNVRHDPAAASAVFAAARAVTEPDVSAPVQCGLRVIPLDVAIRLRVGQRELAQLTSMGPLAQYVAEHSRRWLKQSWWRYQSRSFPAWDLLASLDALDQVSEGQSEGRALIDFDPAATWQRFLEVLRAG